MNIILFGPPGAGKGTQGDNLVKDYNLSKISTGDLLRKEISKKSSLGEKIKQIIDEGRFVSDEIINNLVETILSNKAYFNRLIFDGYPRTISQAIFIDDYLINNNLSFNYFIEFKIDDDSIIERIINRALTESRSDDSKEAIKTRLEKYYEETRPVLDYYQKKYSSIYHKIDGKQEIAKLNNLLLKSKSIPTIICESSNKSFRDFKHSVSISA